MAQNHVWTFVVDFDGGTYVSQLRAQRIEDAIRQYNQTDPSEQGAIPLDEDFALLEGMNNVYCATGSTEGKEILILANIVDTKTD